jgi:uncharacterized coiled-coil protein SlyX
VLPTTIVRSHVLSDLSSSAQNAVGSIAKELLDNPLVTGSLTRVLELRERAVAAQELTLSGLNLPSAADIERLTRRVRSVAQRLEGVEDALDRIEHTDGNAKIEARLTAIEAQLAEIAAALNVKAA